MRPATVLTLSAATLSYEILLVRVFAIEQFHHFAYMVIGVAMLGYGASGTLFTLVRARRSVSLDRWFVRSAILTGVSLLAAPVLVDLVRLDPTQLLWDAAQWPRLGTVYLLLALPFGLGALTVLMAIAAERDRPGSIYGASFVGSGMGAALSVAALWLLDPAHALAVPAILAAAGAAGAAYGTQRGITPRLTSAVTLFAAVILSVRPPWTVDVLPYKALPQISAFPNSRRVADHSSPLGWVVAVEAPAFRYAPGLSLRYRGTFPEQTALLVDGDLAGAATRWSGPEEAAMLSWLPSALPYALQTPSSVLVIGAGGGIGVATAAAHGAETITGVELQPELARWGAASNVTSIATNPETTVRWEVGDARGYAARTEERFDVITLGPIGGAGNLGAGVHSLNEDFLHTVEAYQRYLELLRPGGVVAITGWTAIPPRGNVRVILTATAALRRFDPTAVSDGLMVVRSWGTVTTLIRPAGFTADDVGSIRAWAGERGFDIDWRPGSETPAMRYNILEEPTFFQAAAAAVSGPDEADRFAERYPFEVRPATDARPYPHHFIGLGALGEFFQRSRGDWLPFAEWGFIALVATLAQSAVLAVVLLLLPIAVSVRAVTPRHLMTLIGYFGAIGLAYLTAEIAAIQHLILLLGHPVFAVSAVLTVMLAASGLGSAWSDRMSITQGRTVAIVLAGLLGLYAIGMMSVVHLLQPAPLVARAAVGMLVLAPAAFLMGMPFPLGVRTFAGRSDAHLAWAWAVNGFASVVAVPLAALIALEIGSRVLLGVAALAYAVAVIVHRMAERGIALAGRPAGP